MSMLAERKRKQKWSLNPRGKDWAQDTNKFGHKMLEKMGWSQGKGLGARENGITEHIKVSYKNDSKGLGHTDRNDQWTEHESNFTALLSSLGGSESAPDQLKVSSLEEKSQKSRARVHYKKFTRGKDLSRYSEKDLANIFGKKSLDDFNKSKNKVSEEENKNDDTFIVDGESQPKSSFSINSGLMSDYFKKKLPNFGNVNGFVVGNNGVLKKAEDDDSEVESRPTFGLGFESDRAAKVLGNENPREWKKSFVSFVSGSSEKTQQKEKKKRRNEDDVLANTDTPTKKKKMEISFEETPTKKKKNKKVQEALGLSNPAFDPMHSTPVKINKHTLDIIEESTSEDSIQESAEAIDVSVQVHKNDNSTKKNKKKRRSSLSLNDETFNDSSTNESLKREAQGLDFSDDSLEISLSNKIKKNKKSKNKENINCEGTMEETPSKKKSKKTIIPVEEMDCSVPSELSPKKKSKKKKNKDIENTLGVENPFFNTSIESEDVLIVEENPYEVKTKEKKNKKKKSKLDTVSGLENPTFSEVNSSVDSVDSKFEVKRKKSKSKEELGLDNPALNVSANIEENFEIMLNIATTPIVSKTKNVERRFKSPRGTNSVQRQKSVRFSDVTKQRIIPTKEEIKEMEESQDSDFDADLLNDSIDIEGRLKSDGTEKSSKLFRIKKKQKNKNKIVGLDNGAYDAQKNNLEENLNTISKTLDQYQAELENDINEAKMKSVEISDIMVGEVGNPDGENERLSDGSVKLKFKYAKFKKSAKYHDALLGPKKPYKHLIKGDITVDFRESNLHEIQGYATENASP